MSIGKVIYPWRTGNNLFEILNKLPNYGVGRLVTREKFRYFDPANPSYYRITKVKMDCSLENLDYGEAWGIPTWKGYSQEGLEVKVRSANKKEWLLIRKSEEAKFCHFVPKPEDFTQAPNFVQMPPLLEAMRKAERDSRGLDFKQEDSWIPFQLEVDYTTRRYQIDGAREVFDYQKNGLRFDDITEEQLERTINSMKDYQKQIKEWSWEDKLTQIEESED